MVSHACPRDHGLSHGDLLPSRGRPPLPPSGLEQSRNLGAAFNSSSLAPIRRPREGGGRGALRPRGPLVSPRGEWPQQGRRTVASLKPSPPASPGDRSHAEAQGHPGRRSPSRAEASATEGCVQHSKARSDLRKQAGARGPGSAAKGAQPREGLVAATTAGGRWSPSCR